MAKVDPFLQPIPPELLRDKDTRQFFEYFVRWAHDMWIRTGGGTDEIENAAARESYPWDTTAPSEESLSTSLYGISVDTDHALTTVARAVSVATNYTANESEFINATRSAVITMPEHPGDSATVTIRNGDGTEIVIKGNGRKINGETTARLTMKGTVVDFYYFIDTNEWFAR